MEFEFALWTREMVAVVIKRRLAWMLVVLSTGARYRMSLISAITAGGHVHRPYRCCCG